VHADIATSIPVVVPLGFVAWDTPDTRGRHRHLPLENLPIGMHEADKIGGLNRARAALAAGAHDPTTLATAGFVIGPS